MKQWRLLLGGVCAFAAAPACAQLAAVRTAPVPVIAPAIAFTPAGLAPLATPGLISPVAPKTLVPSLSPAVGPAPQVAPVAALKSLKRAAAGAAERGSRESGGIILSLFDGGPAGKSREAVPADFPVDISRDGSSPKATLRIGPGDSSAGRLDRTRDALRADIRTVLPKLKASLAQRNNPAGEPLALADACCGRAAPELGFLLRREGWAVDVVESEFHVYLSLDTPDGPLLIDPSIRQFFGGRGAPEAVSQVFVGERGRLERLFQENAAAKTTGYGVPRIYFSGEEIRNALIAEVRDAVLGTGSLSGLVTPVQDEDDRAYRNLK